MDPELSRTRATIFTFSFGGSGAGAGLRVRGRFGLVVIAVMGSPWVGVDWRSYHKQVNGAIEIFKVC